MSDDLTLASLMQSYGKGVWRYIFTMTNDANITDDLTQEVFIKVHERLATFRNEASIRTWIFAIAKNKCKDYLRSSFVKRVILFREVESVYALNMEDEIIRHIQGTEVLRALFHVKPIYREIILLHISEDLPFREVAQIVGISEGNAKMRYQRGIKQVREFLSEGVLPDADRG